MKFYIIALIGILFSGCEMTIPVELPEQEPKIVVNSLFAPDKPEWIIKVYKSKGMYETGDYTPLENATVNLYKDEVFLETVVYSSTFSGYRVHQDFLPVPGATYTIKVDVPGMESVEATETVPEAIKINSITINRNVRLNKENQYESDIIINFDDPSGDRDYYGLMVNTYHFGQKMEGASFKSADPAFTDESYTFDSEDYRYFCCEKAIFSDEFFDGKNYNLTITMEQFALENSSVLEIELYTINRSYYLYTTSSQLQMNNRGNPFAEPVIIFNNIKNGFGIFSTYSKDTAIKQL